MGSREYFNDLGVKLWCRMLGVQDKCRKYSSGGYLDRQSCLQSSLRAASPAVRLSATCCKLRNMGQASPHPPN